MSDEEEALFIILCGLVGILTALVVIFMAF